ncbi:glycosyltransferase family 4 protein [Candidatus Parabeggiatoa sp. HSG14]|uniref:glycosyltransferase family 4 protein n=1 Tax=Candidatus Parabeggiatoa sp. HSG14 TaxID=3055593 RepID=UPI0025A90312|nr:glycosyltransferase family 4 protein [Thiotrichales bacterium HSG14]
MKILHVIETLGRGGAEQTLVNLLPALKKRGIECEVATLWSPHSLAPELEKLGIPVHYLNIHHRWSIIEGTIKVARILQKGHFDIIHAHLFFAGFYTATSRLLTSSIYRVITFHNETFTGFPANTIWRKFRKHIESLLTRYWINGKVAVSTAVAQHYCYHLKLSHVEVIHNAFPVKILKPDPKLNAAKVRTRYNLMADEFVIIMPGRLIAQKGHKILLQAINLLKEKDLRPHVLIFGDGPLKDEINQILVAKKLSKQVMLHEAIPHEELMKIVQAADIFAMPSIFEGFGLASAEAMALEIPVIASRVGGLIDFIEDGISGILVPQGNAVALADGIEKLMTEPTLRKQLGKAARQQIETCFSVDIIADRYVRYYEDLLYSESSFRI